MQEICTKYAGICNICNHEFYMQNMQEYALLTLLMQAASLSVSSWKVGSTKGISLTLANIPKSLPLNMALFFIEAGSASKPMPIFKFGFGTSNKLFRNNEVRKHHKF
jgi:hypothetical protein